MAAIDCYQGNTKSISVTLTNTDGTRFNASGCALYYTARPNYVDDPFFTVVTTGLGANLTDALTGLMTLNLTSGNTNLCPGSYPAGFTFVDTQTGISTFGTDGLNILAAPLIF